MYSLQELEIRVKRRVLKEFKNMNFLYFEPVDGSTYTIMCRYELNGRIFLQSLFEKKICVDNIKDDRHFIEMSNLISDNIISEIKFRRECMS